MLALTPRPAIARPTIIAFIVGAAPQTALPTSNITTENKYKYFALNMPNSLPLFVPIPVSNKSNFGAYSSQRKYRTCHVMMVAEPDRTKATPSQLILLTSPNRSTIGDCTSATIVLSSEKRKVEERIVRTIKAHCIKELVKEIDSG